MARRQDGSAPDPAIPDPPMRTPNGSNRFEAETLASARLFLGSLQEGVEGLALPQLIDACERSCHAYDEFPELELEYRKENIAKSVQAAGDTLPDDRAIPLLMFC